ncbi:cellular nucleic acid-binding protein, partial [Trifolium medium]|nr:cellular nucleic acid-binding protein [Trifolium medium]
SEKRGKEMGRGKPYGRGGRRPDEGGSSGGRGGRVRNCFTCGLPGHHFYDCQKKGGKCFKYGDPGHMADQWSKGVVCFNCKEAGHKSNVCKK